MHRGLVFAASIAVALFSGAANAQDARAALTKGCRFYHSLARHGGYVWRYSKDLKLSEGEGETDAHTVWVQPPGTPTVGHAFLDAWQVTGDQQFLTMARETAGALLAGQLQSGGWHYSIHFAPDERAQRGYRSNKTYKPQRRGRDRNNITTLDDDTTTAALRFLMRVDREFTTRGEKNAAIAESIRFGLNAVIAAQAPNGGWRQNWDRYPKPLSERAFPIRKATYPEEWSRKWLNDWRGKYYLNDDVIGQTIRTMLDAWETYGDETYLASAKRGGDFLLLAQMPEPQPAWAQQYDELMHPVWDRKFEPPAISSMESRFAVTALLDLTERTGDRKYLKPIPSAIAYLAKSELRAGRAARFYELQTNRPLYFTRNTYQLTYDGSDVPTHYGFVVDSGVKQLRGRYQRVKAGKAVPANSRPTSRTVQQIIARQDKRGGWLDKRGMRGFRKASQEGVYQSDTFAGNILTLCEYLDPEIRTSRNPPPR